MTFIDYQGLKFRVFANLRVVGREAFLCAYRDRLDFLFSSSVDPDTHSSELKESGVHFSEKLFVRDENQRITFGILSDFDSKNGFPDSGSRFYESAIIVEFLVSEAYRIHNLILSRYVRFHFFVDLRSRLKYLERSEHSYEVFRKGFDSHDLKIYVVSSRRHKLDFVFSSSLLGIELDFLLGNSWIEMIIVLEDDREKVFVCSVFIHRDLILYW